MMPVVRRRLSTVAQWNYRRWHAPDVRKTVAEIRKHYFPRELDMGRKASKKSDPGVSVQGAVKLALERCRTDEAAKGADIVFEAKCRLAGENANGVRGVLTFAKTLNADISVLVFCPEAQWSAVRDAGAAHVGSGELVSEILEDRLRFDRCIATTDQMGVLAKLARVLGPKGLMPNTKTGTLTNDAVAAVKAALLNTPFKIDRESALFRMAVGRSAFSEADVRANIKVCMDYLQGQNRTTEDGKFVETAQLVLGQHVIPIARSEYGHSKGPKKFLAVLEKLRAQVALRQKPAQRAE